MAIERRAATVEIRVEGRKLSGVVMRYGAVSPSHRERFLPGRSGWRRPCTWTSTTILSVRLPGIRAEASP